MEVKYKMIDVSHNNGDIDFAKVKADGIQGVIIRAGYGFNTLDKCFHANIQNALKHGLRVGIYWFGYAGTVAHAKAEAEFLAKTLDQYRGKIDFPIYYDWECDSYNYIKKTYGITATKQLVSDMTKAFCEILENYGWYTGFYANIDYLNNYYNDDIKNRFALWVASWTSKLSYSGQYGIWQYGASTNEIDAPKVNGISSKYVDKDYCYVDYPTTIKNGGFNGYGNTKVNITYNYDVNGDGLVDEKDLKALEEYLKSIGEIEDTTNTQSQTTTYPVWSGVKTFSYSKDKDTFLSPHFKVKEFASIGGSKLYSDNVLISYDLVQMLEKLYTKLKCTAIVINSAYRTATHDKAVGGSGSGQHVLGKAADIVCRNKNGIINSKIVCCVASDLGFGGVANISSKYQAVHVDVRTSSKYYGDEIRGTSSIWNYNPAWTDFYTYFGLTKSDVDKYIS